ncbi:SSI family serine proteinase inhibitor [Nocardia cyriacigeorgica]|uniref:SSI family serine proteinase inhibitor n=1 Tax=Nocardia cyriacigeorgica TaxID=135487 RepID=UPI003D80CFD9
MHLESGRSHPNPEAACDELRSADGNFEVVVKPKSGVTCATEWKPIVVTAQGVWQGKRVSYANIFAYPCQFTYGQGTIFSF